MIAVLDYGAGNLRSVQNALEEIGCEYRLVRDAAGLREADKDPAARRGPLRTDDARPGCAQVREALIERIAEGAPFLGICLGLQALFETSEEAPEARGLGIFPGIVRRFPAHARVPHMGWDRSRVALSEARAVTSTSLTVTTCPKVEYTAAACVYEVPFTAVLEQSNVLGVQFHPEKSGPEGLGIVRRFLVG